MRLILQVLLWLGAVSLPLFASERPNVILILADDLGFSDLGSYGSEIKTPNLDALARDGVRFSNYHTAASCAPSRAMLLTGVDSHRAGVPNIPESIPDSQFGRPNYSGTLNPQISTVANYLQRAGYHTYMAGKWHLGRTPDLLPSARGFERTITMTDTGADNWEQKTYLPMYDKAHWFEDGAEASLPEDFYSSKFFIDKTIEYIDSNAGDGKPFFAYLAFQAVHIPVQAPREYTEKYLDTYRAGWHALRNQRYQGAIDQGVAQPGKPLAQVSTTGRWDDLTAEQQKFEAKQMAVYGGMIDAMDDHVGRLVRHLKKIGEYENTVFLFTSDNGPEGTDPLAMVDGVVEFFFRRWLKVNQYNMNYDTLGEKGSYSYIGPSFASAAASPFAWYKFFSGEGGLRVPLIISGVPGQKTNQVIDAFSWATDVTPTILTLCGVTLPPDERMIGRDLVPLLRGEKSKIYADDDPVGYELGGNAALFKGHYKISVNRPPYGDGQWHLFHLRDDPGETVDLKSVLPELFAELRADYDAYAALNGVLPVRPDYDQRQVVIERGVRRRIASMQGKIYALLAAMVAVGSLMLFLMYRFLVRRRSRAKTIGV